MNYYSNNKNNSDKPYLFRVADKWVSNFTLIGCILITIAVVFVYMMANSLSDSWEKPSMFRVTESQLEEF